MDSAFSWRDSPALGWDGSISPMGVMGGAGVGMAFIVPVSVLVKWFPDRRGLITGDSGGWIWHRCAGDGAGGSATD